MAHQIRAPRGEKYRLGTQKEVDKLLREMKPKRHSDSDHLKLRIDPALNGARFIYAYSFDGRSNESGLGSARLKNSLRNARLKADKADALLAAGEDPRDFLRGVTAAPKGSETLGSAIAEYLPLQTHLRAITLKWWESALKLADFPDLKAKPLATITRADIVTVLKARTPVQRVRLQWQLRKVFDWVIDRAEHEERFGRIVVNPARFKLGNYIGQPVLTVEHVASMPFPEAPAFMSRLRTPPHLQFRGRGAAWEAKVFCLMFHMLTASRPGETKGAIWREIDWVNDLWLIPGSRMKEGLAHGVPLSRQARAILEHMRARNDQSALIFPGEKGKISSFAPLIPRPYTPHGFRTSFKSWAKVQRGPDGRLLYHNDEIVSALAHVVGSVADRAYDRDDIEALRRATEERRGLLQHWADFLDSAPAPAPEVDHDRAQRIAASPIVSKSEAAVALGIKRSTFSMMLKSGRICGEALVYPENRTDGSTYNNARINLEAAREQTRKRIS